VPLQKRDTYRKIRNTSENILEYKRKCATAKGEIGYANQES
jgi:hypothetical protein